MPGGVTGKAREGIPMSILIMLCRKHHITSESVSVVKCGKLPKFLAELFDDKL